MPCRFLQTLLSSTNTELNDLAYAVTFLWVSCKATLQWIPAHCNIHGNDMANELAKEGATEMQEDKPVTFSEAKTTNRANPPKAALVQQTEDWRFRAMFLWY
ncbi:hypothetical protein ElyMa_005980700 [Elysia marginata]|uniref:RNase H type-1 domain-containing protein n=1 Tax=Elysia marginata TaxID=1093978 RepID=A0AAV4GDS9_9GAST|nr:hypothetical protein ElyMa_005980700 [Elysia marginata]